VKRNIPLGAEIPTGIHEKKRNYLREFIKGMWYILYYAQLVRMSVYYDL